MKILAFEFSSPQRSVAIAQVSPSGAWSDHEVVETGALQNRPLGMIDQALRAAGLEREQIELVAIGLGPGSYTGIRAAIALAQGWQLATGVQLLGISSAEAIAAQAQLEGVVGSVNVIIDAQREEVYLGKFQVSSTRVHEQQSLCIVGLRTLRGLEAANEVLVGPEITRWSGRGRTVFPRASTLARLAAERGGFVSGEQLEPIYLRETQFVKAPPPRKL